MNKTKTTTRKKKLTKKVIQTLLENIAKEFENMGDEATASQARDAKKFY